MAKLKLITSSFLEKRKACNSQLALFEKVFPRGARLTERNIVKAFKAGLNIGWLVRATLRGPAMSAYRRSICLAMQAYENTCNLAWIRYERADSLSWPKYKKIRDTAWNKYEKSCGGTWLELLKNQTKGVNY